MIPATVLIILSELLFEIEIRCTGHTNFKLPVAKSGMGRDIWTVPLDNITPMLKVRALRPSRVFVASFKAGADTYDHRPSTLLSTSTRSSFR